MSANLGRQINVMDLQSALGETKTINEYELNPHFLVKIMNIAHADASIEAYLRSHDFYHPNTPKEIRLNIVSNANFFNLLSSEQKNNLFPRNEYVQIQRIVQKNQTEITTRDINRVAQDAKKFKEIENYLKSQGFYQLYNSNPFPVLQLNAIISSPVFQQAVLNHSTELSQYQEYVKSSFVEDEASTGACIDITNVRIQRVSPLEEEQEGRWKLHISIHMEQCDQKIIDEAYNIILTAMQKYNMLQLKVVAPFPYVNSMQGREFTVYLNNEMRTVETNSNVTAFISEIELLLRVHNIPLRSDRDAVNRAIASSAYFSYRNERAKVFTVPPNIRFSSSAEFEAQLSPNYKTGNIIAIYNNKAYFIKQGRLQEGHGVPTDDLKKLKIPLIDGEYISAVGAKNLSKLFRDPNQAGYNPFGYTDDKFKLEQITFPQIVQYWVDWLGTKNNKFSLQEHDGLRAMLASEQFRGRNYDNLRDAARDAEKSAQLYFIDKLCDQDKLRLNLILSASSLEDHDRLRAMLASEQFRGRNYDNLRDAARNAQLTEIAKDLYKKLTGSHGQDLRDYVKDVDTRQNDVVLKQDFIDALDFLCVQDKLNPILSAFSLQEHDRLRAMLASEQFRGRNYDNLRGTIRNARSTINPPQAEQPTSTSNVQSPTISTTTISTVNTKTTPDNTSPKTSSQSQSLVPQTTEKPGTPLHRPVERESMDRGRDRSFSPALGLHIDEKDDEEGKMREEKSREEQQSDSDTDTEVAKIESVYDKDTSNSLAEKLSTAVESLGSITTPTFIPGQQLPDSKSLSFSSASPNRLHVSNSPMMKTLEEAIERNDIVRIRDSIRHLTMKETNKTIEKALSKITDAEPRKSMHKLIQSIILEDSIEQNDTARIRGAIRHLSIQEINKSMERALSKIANTESHESIRALIQSIIQEKKHPKPPLFSSHTFK